MTEPFLLGEHAYRGLSISRVVRVRARIAAKFLIESTRKPRERARRIETLRRLSNTKKEKEALVLGLGPSLGQLDPSKLSRLQREGSIEIFAVNAFAMSSLSTALTPNHYVLTDPAYFGGDVGHYQSTSRASPQLVWDYLADHPEINIYIPHDRCAPTSIASSRILYSNSLGLQGFSRNVSPVRPRGYLAITAYTALAISTWFGYNRIFVMGIDNTQFRSMRLSAGMKVSLGASHAYTEDDGAANEIAIFRASGVAGFFEDVSRLFADLRLFSDFPIENLDETTLVDAFPIARDRDRFVHETGNLTSDV